MWAIILSVLLAYLTYLYVTKQLNYWKDKGVPHIKPWPLFGSVFPNLTRKRALAYIVDDIYSAYPNKRYVGFHIFTEPTLILRDPELIKQVAVKEHHKFPHHRLVTVDTADGLWNKGLFTMTDEWREMRSTLNPWFTSGNLKDMFVLMQQGAEKFIHHYQKQVGSVEVELMDALTRFSNDVFATAALGITCNSLDEPENKLFVNAREVYNFRGSKMLKVFGYTFCPAFMKVLDIGMWSKALTTFFRSTINETLRIREEQLLPRHDIIQLMLEARKRNSKQQRMEITDDNVTAIVLSFLVGGFETVSHLMSYACYELSLNQHVQEKLCEEIDATPKDAHGKITYESLLGMKYLDMVISESLRMWPPHVITDRKCDESFTIEAEGSGEKDLHLEKGMVCWLPIYSIQRDPRFHPNPNTFDPERFSEDNKHKITPFTYIPFGAGPRGCIAPRYVMLESKLIIVEILQKFKIVPTTKTHIPMKLSKKSFSPIPDDGFWLQLIPRHN